MHERIRKHAMAAGAQGKQLGKPNDLLERLKADAAFAGHVEGVKNPMLYVGRSVQQVDEFVAEVAAPLRKRYGKAASAEVRV